MFVLSGFRGAFLQICPFHLMVEIMTRARIIRAGGESKSDYC
jgi:hypothetical protein